MKQELQQTKKIPNTHSEAKPQRKQMSKKKFRIGELAKELQVKKFVIRFWEKEFGLKSDRSQGGQRYYTDEDFKAFNNIKYLLYKQGFTIAGAKVQLEKMKTKKTHEAPTNDTSAVEVKKEKQIRAAVKTIEKPVPYIPKEFIKKIKIFKQQLLELKKNL